MNSLCTLREKGKEQENEKSASNGSIARIYLLLLR
jgi:hypothetical protein